MNGHQKTRRNGNFWGVVLIDVIPFSFFSQNFHAAVSVPRWERSSVCQRLKLHREGGGEKGGQTAGKEGRERREEKEDRR